MQVRVDGGGARRKTCAPASDFKRPTGAPGAGLNSPPLRHELKRRGF
jgi:hypothetical protein